MSTPKLEWFYSDSGHPGSDNYTTVILVHGLGWHGASFQAMFPLAAPEGLRFVALNRRGYPGTTPYTQFENGLLLSEDPAQQREFRRLQGIALARAVIRIVDDLSLPEKGKLGVLGWSTGNWFLLAMVSVLDDPELSADEKAKLGAWVSHAILLEPPCELMGATPPPDMYFPVIDDPDPVQIGRWATGYFDHAELAARDTARLNARDYLASPSPLFDRLSPEEIGKLTFDAMKLDGPLFVPAWLGTHKKVTKAALQKLALWPRLDGLSIIYGDRSFWLTFPGMWAVQDYSAELGIKAPTVKLLKGGNHFMIIDHAKETTALVKEIMSE